MNGGLPVPFASVSKEEPDTRPLRPASRPRHRSQPETADGRRAATVITAVRAVLGGWVEAHG